MDTAERDSIQQQGNANFVYSWRVVNQSQFAPEPCVLKNSEIRAIRDFLPY